VSGDEISFDEVKYREPVRLLRPDRDRRYACLSYHVPGANDLPIFVDHRTADAMERHALSDTSVELGGILLGKECVDEATGVPFVWVSESLEAKHYANTQASFTYTHDSWEEITRERDRRFPELDIVGWYHTHPSFGIFLSHHDLFIHQHFFAQPLQVAYVIDPIQQTRGFFQWRGGSMAQVQGFYLTADRGDRLALAHVANDLENLPNPQGPGGAALSPRLEAELIKMLTRPSPPQYATSPADRVQIAAIFGLLGSFIGVLGVAAGLWLYQLSAQVQEQGELTRALRGSVDQAASGQRLAVDTLLERAGVDKPAQYLERYEVAARARDEARRQLAAQQSINETLGSRTKDLETQVQKLSADLEVGRKRAEQLEVDARKAPELRDRVAELEKSRTELQRDLDEKSAIADSAQGEKAAELLRRLNLYRYAAYFCGVLSLLLGLALGYLYYRPTPEPDSGASEPVPHRIT
jgi:proteasome lid subunit RPN8/RPN11